MFKGIVFDLDGTLIHSEVDFIKMKKKMIAFLLENGTPEGTLSPLMTTVEIMRITETHWEKKGVSNHERTKLRAKIEATMNDVELEALETVIEVPGAKQVIEKLFDMRYKLAILINKRASRIRRKSVGKNRNAKLFRDNFRERRNPETQTISRSPSPYCANIGPRKG